MEICIMSIGKSSSKWIEEGIAGFLSRLKHYISFTLLNLPDIKNAKSLSMSAIKEEEGKMILDNVQPSDFFVVMDERGKEFTSRDFSEWLQKQMNTGRKRIILTIGGPYGFSESVYQRCDYKIALSKMTFTHEMSKLILVEQLYRAMTILKGEPYHHD